MVLFSHGPPFAPAEGQLGASLSQIGAFRPQDYKISFFILNIVVWALIVIIIGMIHDNHTSQEKYIASHNYPISDLLAFKAAHHRSTWAVDQQRCTCAWPWPTCWSQKYWSPFNSLQTEDHQSTPASTSVNGGAVTICQEACYNHGYSRTGAHGGLCLQQVACHLSQEEQSNQMLCPDCVFSAGLRSSVCSQCSVWLSCKNKVSNMGC